MKKTYYDTIAGSYPELHGTEQRKKLALLKQLLSVKTTDHLLDVGCGPGWSARFFPCTITGIDPAQELLARCPPRMHCIRGRAERLPFPDKSFDFIISVTALQNIHGYRKALQEMRRVAKPHARIAITFLKKSAKAHRLEKAVEAHFFILQRMREEKDIVLLCTPRSEGKNKIPPACGRRNFRKD